MEQYIAYNLALGIVGTSSKRKQEIGRAFAEILGFHPGPPGADGGIDGVLFREDNRLIYFQSKLSQSELNVDHAKLLYADIMYHKAVVGIMLAGKGYKKTFSERLFKHPHIEQVNIHLLTLVDVLAKTDKFYSAVQDLPKLRLFEKIDWKQFR
jgi:hypothetical protein